MSHSFRRSLLLLSLSGIAGLFEAACSGSAGPSQPDGTSSTGKGATLVGTVETAPAAAAVHVSSSGPSRSGIRVTVVGTSMSAMTDDSGRFVFTGLSTGKITLHLEGTGIDAQVEISGLVDGQTLTIAIQVKGGTTQVVHPGEESEVDVEGAIESVTPVLKVQGRTITTNANTRIRGEHGETIASSALKVGQVVEVDGMLQADGTILATKIELKNEDEGDEHEGEVELSGTISAKGSNSITVAGRTVMVDGNTKILGHHDETITFAALQPGQRVEVEGRASTTGVVTATKIKQEDDD